MLRSTLGVVTIRHKGISTMSQVLNQLVTIVFVIGGYNVFIVVYVGFIRSHHRAGTRYRC